MMIISFAWTTQAIIQGKKTETRRFWNYDYMERFWKSCQANDMRFIGYNKSPRFGGCPIALCRIKQKPYLQDLKFVTDADEKAEGGLWGSADEYRKAMAGHDQIPYVIKFEVLAQAPDNIAMTADLFKQQK